mmetsp:Transcript_11249/g.27435  ORF Transcript_11249/g.27435 Transcript_11249/m.27435 type:complete len:212 (+) Transcript_11249:1815-2450(+)
MRPSDSGARRCGHLSSNTFHLPWPSFQTTTSTPSSWVGWGFFSSMRSMTATGYHCFSQTNVPAAPPPPLRAAAAAAAMGTRSGAMPIRGLPTEASVASSWSEMMVPPVELVGGDVSTASTGMPLLLFLVRARARCAKAIEGRELEHRDVWNVAGGLRRWVRAAAAEVATEDVVVMATAAAIVVSCVFLAKTNSNSQPSEMQGPRSSAVTDS